MIIRGSFLQEELQKACREAEAADADREGLRRRLASMQEEMATQEANRSKDAAHMVR